MCMSIVPVCMCTMCVQCQWRTEKGVRFPWSAFMDNCELPCDCNGICILYQFNKCSWQLSHLLTILVFFFMYFECKSYIYDCISFSILSFEAFNLNDYKFCLFVTETFVLVPSFLSFFVISYLSVCPFVHPSSSVCLSISPSRASDFICSWG